MKTLSAFVLLVILSINTQAQILSNWGIKLGAGISNQTWDYQSGDSLNSTAIAGLTARLYIDLLDISMFKIQTEAGYIRKGFDEVVPQADGSLTVSNTLDYMNLSLLAKLKIPLIIVTPYILAGPQYNLLLSKNVSEERKVVFDQFKDSNWGYSIGVGTEILDILPICLLVEYRFEKDFNDNYPPSNIDIKNYSHVIMVGIQF